MNMAVFVRLVLLCDFFFALRSFCRMTLVFIEISCDNDLSTGVIFVTDSSRRTQATCAYIQGIT